MKYLLALSLFSFSAVPKEPKVINVMVIDTGIASHVDLKSNVDYDSSENYVDENGHGTHVTGLILLGENLSDRLCPQIRIRSCKYSRFSPVDAIARCVEQASKDKIDYINISGGGPGYLKRERLAFKAFKGIAYAAAGNNAQSLDAKIVYYPASYRYKNNMKNVVMVQSVCASGFTCPYSNSHSKAIRAYGDYIASTSNNNDFKILRGTSQATAIALHAALKKRCNKFKGVKNANR